MIYCYDDAIVEDLKRSFNPHNVPNPVVTVVDPEGIVDIAAQLQDDQIKLPLVSVWRDPDTPIDTDRMNFTRAKKGVPVCFDKDKNNIYYERVIPIKLRYKLTVLTNSTIDMDELLRELLFKYSSQYFLSLIVPYESKRKIRFGVVIDHDGIERESGTFEYLSQGQLHQAIIPMNIEGAVLVTYTPAQLKNVQFEYEAK